MRVYEILRKGLLEDKLIGKQPAFATNHLRKVGAAACVTMTHTIQHNSSADSFAERNKIE